MPRLHTAFQDGFDDDRVILRVAGSTVFDQSHLKTRTQIGLAATHEAEIPLGPVVVDLSLPGRHLSTTVPLNVTHDTYLGFSVTPSGQLEHVVAHEPFGYL